MGLSIFIIKFEILAMDMSKMPKHLKKIVVLILFLQSWMQSFSQNHRQFASWLCGNYQINKSINNNDASIGAATFENLSDIESSNYWVLESVKINQVSKQRLLHVLLLDSGYVGVEEFGWKNSKKLDAASAKSLIPTQLTKLYDSMEVYVYNREQRGFVAFNSTPKGFIMDKYALVLKCCNHFANFYFKDCKTTDVVYLKKNID